MEDIFQAYDGRKPTNRQVRRTAPRWCKRCHGYRCGVGRIIESRAAPDKQSQRRDGNRPRTGLRPERGGSAWQSIHDDGTLRGNPLKRSRGFPAPAESLPNRMRRRTSVPSAAASPMGIRHRNRQNCSMGIGCRPVTGITEVYWRRRTSSACSARKASWPWSLCISR